MGGDLDCGRLTKQVDGPGMEPESKSKGDLLHVLQKELQEQRSMLDSVKCTNLQILEILSKMPGASAHLEQLGPPVSVSLADQVTRGQNTAAKPLQQSDSLKETPKTMEFELPASLCFATNWFPIPSSQ